MVATAITGNSGGNVSFNWPSGSGVNGEVVKVESLEELNEFLKTLNFKSELSPSTLVNNSSLRLGTQILDSELDIKVRSDYWVYSNSWHAAQGESSIYDDGDNVVIEYAESFREHWHQKNIANDLKSAFSIGSTQGTSVDSQWTINEDDYSGYLLLDVYEFSVHSVLRKNGETTRGIKENGMHPDPNSALIAIGITPQLLNDIERVSNGQSELTRHTFEDLYSENSDNSNIKINIGDHLNEDGSVNTDSINSELDLNVILKSNLAEYIQENNPEDITHARLSAHFTVIGQNSGGFINDLDDVVDLTIIDHDSQDEIYGTAGELGYVSGAIVGNFEDVVEFPEEGYTELEVGFDEDSLIRLLANADPSTQQIDLGLPYRWQFDYETPFVNIENDWNDGGWNSKETTIKNITLNLEDVDFSKLPNPDPSFEDSYLELNPKLEVIDFAAISNSELQETIEFEIEGYEQAYFNINYGLYDEDVNGVESRKGDISLNGRLQQHETGKFTEWRGTIWEDLGDVEIDKLSPKLSGIYFSGNGHGFDWGSLSLSVDSSGNETSVNIGGSGWGNDYHKQNVAIDDLSGLPDGINFNIDKFYQLDFLNLSHAQLNTFSDITISNYFKEEIDPSIALSYSLHKEGAQTGEIDSFENSLNQIAVLGDSLDRSSRYVLEINAKSLEYDYAIESTDITIKFDPRLFASLDASDITIDGSFPIANAVKINDDDGTIRLAASSLADLNQGTGISSGNSPLASICLDFDEDQIKLLGKNEDGSLKINPLSFQITANDQETIFSKTFTDDSGLTNREIVSLADLGGGFEVTGQDVTLYEAKVNLAQQGDGLVLGTQRVIGSDASITNLVRSGDTLTTSAEWLNVGNIQANNLSYESLYNQNASLVSADFSKSSIASGSFIDGVFVKDARESTVLTTDIKITGEAGNVVDLADGIVSVKADAEGSDSFSNAGKGSSNLITFQGDLNYDGRVSMKDLAYLNAGAARQQLVDGVDDDGNADVVVSEASYARDVDADFSGKIDLADLSVLDFDWGKTLHTGDEQFQGSSDISWSELDDQGSYSSWDNDSFKDQNEIEADADYAGSLESPAAASVIGADGITIANDNDITGTEFQDPIPA